MEGLNSLKVLSCPMPIPVVISLPSEGTFRAGVLLNGGFLKKNRTYTVTGVNFSENYGLFRFLKARLHMRFFMQFRCDFAYETCPSLPHTGF